jgi:two-component system, chemotaxis family, chemotaxis protein CheY
MQRILIVDDSTSIRESFTDILSPLATCEVATNGQEAVDLVKRTINKGGRFDLVLMDIIMPEKDGLSAVKEIREFESSRGRTGADCLTIIIVTTIREPSRILVAQYECGADAYITKPFTRETVLQTLCNNGLVYGNGYPADDFMNQNQWSCSR